MLNMVRAQLFRIARSRVLIVYAILFCLAAFATPFSIWLNKAWPAFAELGLFTLPDEQLSTLQLYGASFVVTSFTPMVVSIATGYFVASDFKSGFVKNLVQARGGRVSYAAASVACAAVLSAVTTIAGIVVVEATLRVQGYVSQSVSFVEMLQWSAQVALCTTAYASLTVLIAVATKSETVAVLCAIFIGAGAVEQLGGSLLARAPETFSVLRRFFEGYLAADVELLAEGIVCDPATYVQALATILIVGALAALVMRRRSLG